MHDRKLSDIEHSILLASFWLRAHLMRGAFLILLAKHFLVLNSCVSVAADSHCRYEKSQCKKLDYDMACSRHGTRNLKWFLDVAESLPK